MSWVKRQIDGSPPHVCPLPEQGPWPWPEPVARFLASQHGPPLILDGDITFQPLDLGTTTAQALDAAEHAAAVIRAATGPCRHPDAVPVDLVTGERVAALCTTCLEQLPASWLDELERRAAERARVETLRATCTHPEDQREQVYITTVGSPVPTTITWCGTCGEDTPATPT